MDMGDIAAIAAISTVFLAIVGLSATAIFRIGKLTEATDRIPEEFRAELQTVEARNEERFQRVDDRFQYMEALNEERFRRMEERMEERFQRMEERMEERFQRMEDLIHHNEELIRSESERIQGQILILQQAIMTHSHDQDGNVMFRVPMPDTEE